MEKFKSIIKQRAQQLHKCIILMEPHLKVAFRWTANNAIIAFRWTANNAIITFRWTANNAIIAFRFISRTQNISIKS